MKKLISYLAVYLKDSSVRLNAGIFFGLLWNLFYVVFNLILGIKQENVWLVAVAAYHMLLTVLRLFLLEGESGSKSNGKNEELIGCLMLVLTVPMTGMIIYTVLRGTARSYPRATLPIFAVYAVFSIFRAAYGLLFSKKPLDLRARTVYSIRLSIALSSLFNLQTSLFFFLKINTPLTAALNFLTGGAVSFSMLSIARQSRKTARN